jgi:hypothetical protein
MMPMAQWNLEKNLMGERKNVNTNPDPDHIPSEMSGINIQIALEGEA